MINCELCTNFLSNFPACQHMPAGIYKAIRDQSLYRRILGSKYLSANVATSSMETKELLNIQIVDRIEQCT